MYYLLVYKEKERKKWLKISTLLTFNPKKILNFSLIIIFL
jgi:hypothetical protein